MSQRTLCLQPTTNLKKTSMVSVHTYNMYMLRKNFFRDVYLGGILDVCNAGRLPEALQATPSWISGFVTYVPKRLGFLVLVSLTFFISTERLERAEPVSSDICGEHAAEMTAPVNPKHRMHRITAA
jgi:hypothetical protein